MTEHTFGKKYTFYNTKIAINFQAVTSRGHFNTINVEMAPKDQQGKVNWSVGKIALQLSEIDVFKIFYCIIHKRKLCYKSEFHGTSKRKSISFIEDEKGNCKITLKDNGNPLYFEVSPGQWFYAKLLITEQVLGLPVSFEDTKKLMATPLNPDEEKASFEKSPLGESLREIKDLLTGKT